MCWIYSWSVIKPDRRSRQINNAAMTRVLLSSTIQWHCQTRTVTTECTVVRSCLWSITHGLRQRTIIITRHMDYERRLEMILNASSRAHWGGPVRSGLGRLVNHSRQRSVLWPGADVTSVRLTDSRVVIALLSPNNIRQPAALRPTISAHPQSVKVKRSDTRTSRRTHLAFTPTCF